MWTGPDIQCLWKTPGLCWVGREDNPEDSEQWGDVRKAEFVALGRGVGGRLDLMDLTGKGGGEAKIGSILSGSTENSEADEIMDWLMVVG